jgi:hypothetical protein
VIQHTATVGALLAGSVAVSRDTRRAATRQRLARLLLEHPVLALDDLTSEERGYLASQATSLAADLHRLTGAQVERRAEGVALIDATGSFSDRSFPAGGTPAQVALLLADAMAHAVSEGAAGAAGSDGAGHVGGGVPAAAVPRASDRSATLVARLDAARPSPPSELAAGEGDRREHDRREDDARQGDRREDVPREDDRRQDHRGPVTRGDATAVAPTGVADLIAEVEAAPQPTGPFLSDAWLLERLDALTAAHRRAIAAEYRDDPEALLRVATEVLVAFDLVRPVPGGLIARPILARFRDPVVEVASTPQPSLFATEVPTGPAHRATTGPAHGAAAGPEEAD